MLHFLNSKSAPLKGYNDDDGLYHVAFSLSTTDKDMYGNIFSKAALESMVEQARKININANHRHDLKSLIGPVADAWLDTKDGTTYLWVDVRVRSQWTSLLQDLIEAGTRLGGSLEVDIEASNISKDKKGRNIIMDAVVTGGAITGDPANRSTQGTLQTVVDGCPGSTCHQKNDLKLNSDLGMVDGDLKDHVIHLLSVIEKEEIRLSKEENKEFNDVDIQKSVIHNLMEYLKKQLELLTGKESKKEEPKDGRSDSLSSKYYKTYDLEKYQKSEDEIEKLQLENKELVKKLETTKTVYKESLEQIKFLEDKNVELKTQLQQKEHNELVNKALELNHKLNPDSGVNSEESLLAEIRSHFQLEEEGDVDRHILNYVKLMELSLKKMPEGSIPQTHNNESHITSKDLYNKKIQRLEDKLSRMGQMGD